MKKLFSEIPYIESERLILRKIGEEDAEGLSELTHSPNVYRYLPTFLFEKKYEDVHEVISSLYDECFRESIILGVFMGNVFCGLAEIYGFSAEPVIAVVNEESVRDMNRQASAWWSSVFRIGTAGDVPAVDTKAIEKAILAANLGFTPQNTGEFIRIVVPSPTEERRKELVKKTRQDAEQNKVSVRNIRRTANDIAKKLKDNGIPEDMVKKLEGDIQKMTDEFIAKIEKMADAKEKEIMTV